MELLRKMKVRITHCVYTLHWCTLFIATSPTLNWVKSRCSLEYQYGNLTLLRVAEVTDSYFPDPTIKTVSILRHEKFYKRPNKSFHGITVDIMDIYPVIKYSEIKFTERLATIKSKGTKKDHDYKEVSPLGEADTKNVNKTPSSPEKVDITGRPIRRKHTYGVIDYDGGTGSITSDSVKKDVEHSFNERKTSVYEILDLAAYDSSKQSLIQSHTEESQAVEALDLDSSFRTRSLITVSCKASETGSLFSETKISRQRSLQVANELSRSMEIKSKKDIIPKRRSTGSHSSKSTNSSYKKNLHLNLRNQPNRLSNKRYYATVLFMVTYCKQTS